MGNTKSTHQKILINDERMPYYGVYVEIPIQNVQLMLDANSTLDDEPFSLWHCLNSPLSHCSSAPDLSHRSSSMRTVSKQRHHQVNQLLGIKFQTQLALRPEILDVH